MDKIPKLRRKPKPPAIETNVERTSTDTSESNISNNAPAAGAPVLADTPSPRPSSRPTPSRTQSPARRPTPATETKDRKQQLQQQPSGKKSPFRGLKLRTSAKRARESSPAASSSSPPTLPPITNRDGVKVPKNGNGLRGAHADDNDVTMEDQQHSDPGPIMPAFLEQETRDMDMKFEDINWDERIRLSKGQTTYPSYESRWGSFKQTDAQEKGLMDRYMNIKPWNHNRIKLQVPEGQLDYVNASEITLNSPSDSSRPPFRYIAMQGPTQPSIPYVWRMITEQVESPSVIIQLTSNFENGAQKCFQYFPGGEDESEWSLNDDDVWEDGWNATLKFESIEMLCDDKIEKRQFSLQVEGQDEARAVYHFWYRGWPDFGVPSPDDLDSFFELMRLSREHSSPNGPRIVHCSAGVGRTGTFIALEHLVRELDVGALCDSEEETASKSKPDLIYDTVQALRQQRKGMVQTEQQYQFLYQVLKKLWTDRYGVNDDEDEDKAEGGVELPKADRAAGENLADPFWEADDDDDGGAKVVPNSANG